MKYAWGAALLGVALFGVSVADAAVVQFDTVYEFSGAYSPSADAPWLTTTFSDTATPGEVLLTLDATGLAATEFVSTWLLNLDPDLDPQDLVFSAPVKTGSFDNPAILTGANLYKAAGGGQFDIELSFETANEPSENAKRFGPGESVQYTVSGIAGLSASSFDFESVSGEGEDSYPVAAHVQGIGPNAEQSGWVTTPEPGTLALLLLGAAAVIRRRRK